MQKYILNGGIYGNLDNWVDAQQKMWRRFRLLFKGKMRSFLHELNVNKSVLQEKISETAELLTKLGLQWFLSGSNGCRSLHTHEKRSKKLECWVILRRKSQYNKVNVGSPRNNWRSFMIWKKTERQTGKGDMEQISFHNFFIYMKFL